MDVGRAYRVLLKVAERGFDTVGFNYGGLSLILKTLTPHELDMARYHSFGRGILCFRLYRMAYATFMANGVMTLENRQEHVDSLVDMYGSLPVHLFENVEETAIRLQGRYRRYCNLVEGFSYSTPSRLLWKSRRGSPLLSPEVTHIPGTSTLGIPESVEVWSLVNMSLDQEVESDKRMSNALFLTSATNPKGSQKVGAGIKGEKELIEKNRRMLVEYGSEAHKRITKDKSLDKKERWTAKLDTAKDIMDELERQMHGVQDKHDLFIEGYRVKLRRELQEREEVEKKRLEEVRRQRGGDPHTGSFEVTPEEMERVMRGEATPMGLAKQKAEEDRVRIAASEVPIRPGATAVVGKRVIGEPRGSVR